MKKYEFKNKTITMLVKSTQNGITLIALVITIILLLILAGVVLNSALGENGIINFAQKAVKDYQNASIYEQNQLATVQNHLVNSHDTPSPVINRSEEEALTNETWYGKPVYTKIIHIESLNNPATGTYYHNIPNVETIWINHGKSFVDMGTLSESRVNETYELVEVHPTSLAAHTTWSVNTTYISWYGKENRSSAGAYVVVEYTKTTD